MFVLSHSFIHSFFLFAPSSFLMFPKECSLECLVATNVNLFTFILPSDKCNAGKNWQPYSRIVCHCGKELALKL